MRAFIKTERTAVKVRADLFKVDGDCVFVYDGEKIMAIIKLKNLVEMHLSEERINK